MPLGGDVSISDQHWWRPAPSKAFSLGTLLPSSLSGLKSPLLMARAEVWPVLFPLSEEVHLRGVAVANPRLAQGTWGSESGPALEGLSWRVLSCGGHPPELGGGSLGRKKGLAGATRPLARGRQQGTCPQPMLFGRRRGKEVGVGLSSERVIPQASRQKGPGTQQEPRFRSPGTASPSLPPQCCHGSLERELKAI